jgi:hypothetical protein
MKRFLYTAALITAGLLAITKPAFANQCRTPYDGTVAPHEYFNFTEGTGIITDVTGDGIVRVFDIPNGEAVGELLDETEITLTQWAYDSNCELWIKVSNGWVHSSGVVLRDPVWY